MDNNLKKVFIVVFLLGSLPFVIMIEENAGNVGMTPIESQRAECTLISGDVRASAEATVSRKLEGFCSTDHLTRSFINLENRLLAELNHLRATINLLLPPLYQQHYFANPNPTLYQPIPIPTPTIRDEASQMYESANITKSSTTNKIDMSPEHMQNESPLSDSDVQHTTESIEFSPSESERVLEFKPVHKKQHHSTKSYKKLKTGPRDFEIHKFNNTILSGADLQIFTYYWKIEQFPMKIKSNISFMHSPVFSISGLHLCVKATFNHLNRDYLYLQLEQVKMDNDKNGLNIILKSGDAFEKIQTNIFFKHKIVILDQVTPTSDLVSQEFNNTLTGFLVPNNAILTGPYSKNENLLIKIIITL